MQAAQPSTLEATVDAIADTMPVALDMIATMMDEPTPSWETFAGLLEVAEQTTPLLILALVRSAAGLATVAEMTPDQVRALATPDMPTGAPSGL